MRARWIVPRGLRGWFVADCGHAPSEVERDEEREGAEDDRAHIRWGEEVLPDVARAREERQHREAKTRRRGRSGGVARSGVLS